MPVRPSGKNRTMIAFADPVTVPDQTAAKTLKSDEFLEACQGMGVKASKRQAARYNARAGRWINR